MACWGAMDEEGCGHSTLNTQHGVASRQEALQRLGAAGVPEPGQGLLLDLPHPLTGDAEEGADLFEGLGFRVVEAEVEPEDLPLPVLELVQDLLDALAQRVLEGLVVG